MKVFDLELFDSHYYIKQKSIVAKIPFGNRTFYAKFKHIDAPLTPLLFRQHLNRDHTIAAPLVEDGKTNYLVIEYSGEEHQRFFHLLKHMMQSQQIEEYQIYQGKQEYKIQLFIPVENISISDAEEILQSLSAILEQQLEKSWKCLPSTSLPEEYNIVTLPYKKLS